MTSRRRVPSIWAIVWATLAWPGAALGNDSGPALPSAVSGFNGWRGVKIVHRNRCPECCNLAFPAEFGNRNEAELGFLESIVGKGQFRNDLDCVMLIDQDALKQIVKLAVKAQDETAALAIVRANGGGGMSLGGGELSEVFASEYLIPVLLGFRRIAALLTPDLEGHVATQICYAAYSPSTSEDVDEAVVITKLNEKGAKSLALAIEGKCDEVRRQFGQ
jgi:hypothetical protein